MAQVSQEVVVTQRMKRSFQKAKIEILNAGGEYPDTPSRRDVNNDSVALMLRYKRVKVIFPDGIRMNGGIDLVAGLCPRSRNSCHK